MLWHNKIKFQWINNTPHTCCLRKPDANINLYARKEALFIMKTPRKGFNITAVGLCSSILHVFYFVWCFVTALMKFLCWIESFATSLNGFSRKKLTITDFKRTQLVSHQQLNVSRVLFIHWIIGYCVVQVNSIFWCLTKVSATNFKFCSSNMYASNHYGLFKKDET